MDKRAFKNFITKRSTVWTLSLCMTGIIVLGGIAAVDKTRRTNDEQTESEIGQVAYLEEEIPGQEDDIEDALFPTLVEDESEDSAQVSGSTVEDDEFSESGTEVDEDENVSASAPVAGTTDDAYADGASEAASAEIVSEQVLLQEGINFTDEESLMWPAAGTILIDYSMDSSVYFSTLNQYKYNPALIISSDVGNQVLASAKGIVESIGVDDVTGTTLVLNIGNGYRLTYGQLKELAVAEGDVVEQGAVLGYVSEPTKYYSVEGSNLYFQMTQEESPVDPVLYLE